MQGDNLENEEHMICVVWDFENSYLIYKILFCSSLIIVCYLISLSKFNLPLIGTFTWPTPPGPYRATTCRGRELISGSHTYFFDHTRTMEGLPGWVIGPLPGPPPRQHKHERQYTPSTHSVIPTGRIWNDDYDGQMIFGDLRGLKFPDICLTGEEKPRKHLTQETCPDRGSNLGPLRDKHACNHLLHSGGRLLSLDSKKFSNLNTNKEALLNFRLQVAKMPENAI